jgi:hypothetical protein
VKSTIDKRIWNIDDLTNSIRRLELQQTTGNITEVMKDGTTVMNKFELASLIQNHKWLRDGEFNGLYSLLAELRASVGHKDVAKNIVMTEEQFDSLVTQISETVKKYGYNLFEVQ